MNIPTSDDLKAVENRLLSQLLAIQAQIRDAYPRKRWLKSKEFMEHFDIGHPDTLKKMRLSGEVKAKLKIGVWYYDVDSFLPS